MYVIARYRQRFTLASLTEPCNFVCVCIVQLEARFDLSTRKNSTQRFRARQKTSICDITHGKRETSSADKSKSRYIEKKNKFNLIFFFL